ncbi:hypothetical protein Tco_0286738 [Tanacetum coccineum]
MKETLYVLLKDEQNNQLGNNDEAKMTLYNALPRKEYELVFMCKTAKEVWHTLIKANHNKNHVRKFLHALPLKWRSKVMTIEEAKDLTTLPLDDLIGNLKVYETILGIDGVISKPIKDNIMPIALKANITRGQTSSDSISQDKCDEDEEINLIAKNFRKLFQKGFKKHDKFDICTEKTKGGSSRRERGCYIVVIRITSLMIVLSLKETRHFSEELGVIAKMGTNLKITQHVLWHLTLKSYGISVIFKRIIKLWIVLAPITPVLIEDYSTYTP